MFPYIGFIETYNIMLVLGIVACFCYLHIYFTKRKLPKRILYTVEIEAIISIIVGLVTAILFQNLYDFIESPSTYKWTFAMTFYGGLIGGAATFILLYFLYFKKKEGTYFNKVLIIAPACITIAHGFGRIGCFFAGCCYGKATDSWLGVKFPDLDHKVLPTNLFEAIFLILLSLVLLYLAVRKDFKYNFPIYLISYGIWRFIIEFFRGDHRGELVGSISPSQFWSILLVIGGIIYILYLIFINKKQQKNVEA